MRSLLEFLTRRCPQCGSRRCGPIACRFSGYQHTKYPKGAVEAVQQPSNATPWVDSATAQVFVKTELTDDRLEVVWSIPKGHHYELDIRDIPGHKWPRFQ